MGDRSDENRRSAAKKSLLVRLYRARMRAGLEVCRRCGRGDEPGCPLTFDHIVAISHEGAGNITNVTILCLRCNNEKGREYWDQPSLAEEEDDAPPERQWSKLVFGDLHRRRYDCPVCGGRWVATTNRRLSIHPGADGQQRCPGTRTRVPDGSVEAVLQYSLSQLGAPGTSATDGAKVRAEAVVATEWAGLRFAERPGVRASSGSIPRSGLTPSRR